MRRSLFLPLTAGALLLIATSETPAWGESVIVEAPLSTIHPDGRIECAGVSPVRLIGIDAEAARPLMPGTRGPLALALERLIGVGESVRLEIDGASATAPGEPGAWVWRGERLVNEAVLRSGDAVFFPEFDRREHMAELVAAAREAVAGRRGIFADSRCEPLPEPAPRVGGVALPLFGHEEDFDYRPRIDEIAALGATWISLVPFHFLATIRDVEIIAVPGRTPSDEVLVKTGAYAREKGLRVFVLPIVHLLKPGAREWRGAFEPQGERRREFFSNYARFITHQADLARQMGADLFAVGSELIRLEDDAESWSAVIDGCRARFPGLLTYSANWDHYRNIAYWDALDVIGLTGYYTLATVDDPTRNDLRAGWRVPRHRLVEFAKSKGKPAMFTEIGYPSRDGAAKAPWDYVTITRYDGDEQADCLAAFFEEFKDEPQVSGVFVYDWWDFGGAGDVSYSPRGKPAESVVKDGLRAFLDANAAER